MLCTSKKDFSGSSLTICFVLFLVILMTDLGFASNPDGVKTYYALIVGSADESQSTNGDKDKSLAKNDVERICYYLTNFGSNWSSNNINKLILNEVSESAIEQKIENIGSGMDGDDVFFFYYTGHAGYDPEFDYGALVLHSGENFDPDELSAALDNNIPSEAKKIIILNTCHSGYFADRFSDSGKPNTAVITSSQYDQFTPFFTWWLGAPWTQTLFCHLFSTAIDGSADAIAMGGNGNREVSVQEAYNFLDWRISQNTFL